MFLIRRILHGTLNNPFITVRCKLIKSVWTLIRSLCSSSPLLVSDSNFVNSLSIEKCLWCRLVTSLLRYFTNCECECELATSRLED